MITTEDDFRNSLLEAARFTSIDRAPVGGQELVLAACTRDLSESEVADLIGTVIDIDDAHYVVCGSAVVGKTFLLRVRKPNWDTTRHQP